MCGIIGYCGHRPAVPVVIEGLQRLEYRGYDSAGAVWTYQNQLQRLRAEGKLIALADKLAQIPMPLATCAMGHTRWATHGKPSENNAHPHFSNDQNLAIVHNGIIENWQEIKNELLNKGYTFNSETDTEVLVNLIAEYLKTSNSLLEAINKTLKVISGAYAFCLIASNEPEVIYAVRHSAPLIIGLGAGEHFLASDIPAFLPYTRQVIFPEDLEIIKISSSQCQIFANKTLNKTVDKSLERESEDSLVEMFHVKQEIQWDIQSAQRSGYRHFMLKEIFEQPEVMQNVFSGRILAKSQIALSELTTSKLTASELTTPELALPELDQLAIPKRLQIIACGTSYHSGLWAKQLFESLSEIPVQVEIASEFRYREKLLLNNDDLVVVISQSGETADTLAALRAAKAQNVTVCGICNVVGSSIAREAKATLYTQAGPEISVASTKAMTSQMLLLSLMALYFAKRKGTLSTEELNKHLRELLNIPQILEKALPDMQAKAKFLARKYSQAKHFFYLGRGHCYALALEGALKLKELSYIHAEGYASGEMKHGPIALIDPDFPTFALALQDKLLAKVKSNLLEIKARQGQVIALTSGQMELGLDQQDDCWEIPHLDSPFIGFLALPALQLFSYEMADYLGKDVDQPRNLAKSVTVE